jgi:hypothetical protein
MPHLDRSKAFSAACVASVYSEISIPVNSMFAINVTKYFRINLFVHPTSRFKAISANLQ